MLPRTKRIVSKHRGDIRVGRRRRRRVSQRARSPREEWLMDRVELLLLEKDLWSVCASGSKARAGLRALVHKAARAVWLRRLLLHHAHSAHQHAHSAHPARQVEQTHPARQVEHTRPARVCACEWVSDGQVGPPEHTPSHAAFLPLEWTPMSTPTPTSRTMHAMLSASSPMMTIPSPRCNSTHLILERSTILLLAPFFHSYAPAEQFFMQIRASLRKLRSWMANPAWDPRAKPLYEYFQNIWKFDILHYWITFFKETKRQVKFEVTETSLTFIICIYCGSNLDFPFIKGEECMHWFIV